MTLTLHELQQQKINDLTLSFDHKSLKNSFRDLFCIPFLSVQYNDRYENSNSMSLPIHKLSLKAQILHIFL